MFSTRTFRALRRVRSQTWAQAVLRVAAVVVFCRLADEVHAALIVLGVHRRRPVQRRLLGATADAVVEKARYAVLVVVESGEHRSTDCWRFREHQPEAAFRHRSRTARRMAYDHGNTPPPAAVTCADLAVVFKQRQVDPTAVPIASIPQKLETDGDVARASLRRLY